MIGRMSGLTVVLSDSRTERFENPPSEVWADLKGHGRTILPWRFAHRAEIDGALLIDRVEQDFSDGDGRNEYGIEEVGRREVARFRPGLWDYVRED